VLVGEITIVLGGDPWTVDGGVKFAVEGRVSAFIA